MIDPVQDIHLVHSPGRTEKDVPVAVSGQTVDDDVGRENFKHIANGFDIRFPGQ